MSESDSSVLGTHVASEAYVPGTEVKTLCGLQIRRGVRGHGTICARCWAREQALIASNKTLTSPPLSDRHRVA